MKWIYLFENKKCYCQLLFRLTVCPQVLLHPGHRGDEGLSEGQPDG